MSSPAQANGGPGHTGRPAPKPAPRPGPPRTDVPRTDVPRPGPGLSPEPDGVPGPPSESTSLPAPEAAPRPAPGQDGAPRPATLPSNGRPKPGPHRPAAVAGPPSPAAPGAATPATATPATVRPGRRPTHAGRPVPPGGSPLRVDPSTLRPTPGAPPGSGGLGPLPPTTPPQQHLPVVEETSAGGVVVRATADGPHAAVIVRRNRAGRLEWCLPKGHLEGVETPPEAAVREVFEETGIVGRIRTTLGVIDYWFSGETRRVHKVVHHYLLTMTGGRLTVEGDPDGEAEDAFWVAVAELPQRLSYPNEQKLAVVAQQLLARDPGLAHGAGE